MNPDFSLIANGKANSTLTATIDPEKICRGKWWLSINSLTLINAPLIVDFAVKISCNFVASDNTVRYFLDQSGLTPVDPCAHLETLQIVKLHQDDKEGGDLVVPLSFERQFYVNRASDVIEFRLTPLALFAAHVDVGKRYKDFGEASACLHFSLSQQQQQQQVVVRK